LKFDIFYQLPEAANQITTERYRELIAEAAEADRLGFNTVWLAEVHFAPRFSVMPTPLLLLAAIAERTTNIRLGMAVNLMPLHHPIRLAEEVAAAASNSAPAAARSRSTTAATGLRWPTAAAASKTASRRSNGHGHKSTLTASKYFPSRFSGHIRRYGSLPTAPTLSPSLAQIVIQSSPAVR
jgi:hypothetical protein